MMDGILLFRKQNNFIQKKFMKQIFSLLLFSAFLFSANAQNKFDKLDGYFDTIAKYNKAMGTVVLAKKGQTIYERSLGYADLENKKPNNDSTEYRIGSISKSFTATLILKAKEQSKLLLDQTINKWFPNIKNANKITVSNLLYHRSGIHNFTDDSSYLSWNTKPQSEAQLISRIEKGGSDFEPDSKMQYSNSNYVLLTIILERVNGKSYQRLLNEQIIKPLKLTHTYYGGKINAARNEAYSYDYNGEKYEKSTETDMSVPLGAGAIVSTPSDLVKFINALFAGKVLSKESLAVMTSPKDNLEWGFSRFLLKIKNHGAIPAVLMLSDRCIHTSLKTVSVLQFARTALAWISIIFPLRCWMLLME